MAEIIGYTVINGHAAKNYELFHEVHTQQEIEVIREHLKIKHPDRKVLFILKQLPNNGLKY